MNHYSLFELNSLIKNTLSRHLEPSYWVVAEIAEMHINQKGHCYLEVVERSGDEVIAKVKGTIWAYTFRNLSAWFESITHRQIQTGLKLLMNIQVQFHEVFGFSLNVRDIDPTYTLGETEKKKAAVIDKLTKDGIIDMNRELLLPLVPQRVAVISSPTAAGLEDFLHQLAGNPEGYLIKTRLYKAIMQGQDALKSIPDALLRVNQRIQEFDLVVIIRGGGSQVDLDCYDSYEISSHIAQFPIPVLTGIGHERDESIADRAAHTQLKTPTATAEFILNGFREFEETLLDLNKRLADLSEALLDEEKKKINDFATSVRLHSRGLLQSNNTRIDFLIKQLLKSPFSMIEKNQTNLNRFEERLRLLDPASILKRGYTISTINKKLLKNVKLINSDAELVTHSYNKLVKSRITEVVQNGKE